MFKHIFWPNTCLKCNPKGDGFDRGFGPTLDQLSQAMASFTGFAGAHGSREGGVLYSGRCFGTRFAVSFCADPQICRFLWVSL